MINTKVKFKKLMKHFNKEKVTKKDAEKSAKLVGYLSKKPIKKILKDLRDKKDRF